MEGRLVFMGIVLGIVGALPSVFLLERVLHDNASVSVAAGLASIAVSFAVLTCSIFAVWVESRQHVLVFGVATVASFLLLWAFEAVRAWRAAQRAQRQFGRKEEW